MTTVSTTPPQYVQTTPQSAGKVIIDERLNLQSGDQANIKKYAFEDYGFVYLYPKDSFSVSINSDKPINVLVIDKADEEKFVTVKPEWDTTLKRDQWDYSPTVPLIVQSNILKKDFTVTIKDKSKYFLIIDPRFVRDRADVHVDVRVTKL
jgi:hypothetical protein